MGVERAVGAVVALAIAAGGYGCRQIVADQAGDRINAEAEERIDEAYERWESPTTVTIDVGGDDEPAAPAPTTEPAVEEVDVPEGWPADLAVVEDLDVMYTTADALGLNITGHIDEEVVIVGGQVKTHLADAGFTVADEELRTEPDGRLVQVITATGPEHTATVSITETPEDPQGPVTVVYLLVPTA